MCATTGPKLFLPPNQIGGAGGTDVPMAYPSSPQTTFDAGNPANMPKPPQVPTMPGGPVYGGGPISAPNLPLGGWGGGGGGWGGGGGDRSMFGLDRVLGPLMQSQI